MPLGIGGLRGAIGGAGKAVSNAFKPSGGGMSGAVSKVMSAQKPQGIGPTPQMLQQSQIPPMSPPPQPSDSMPMDQPMQPNPFQANPFSATGIVPPQQSGMTGGPQSPMPPPSPMQSPMSGFGPQQSAKPMMGPMMGGGPQTMPKPQGMGIGPSMMRPAMRRGMRQ